MADKFQLRQTLAAFASRSPDKGAVVSGPAEPLRPEYETQQALFAAQPPLVQRFLEAQARQVAEALVQRVPQVRFKLPDRVVVDVPAPGQEGKLVPVPSEFREQLAGGIIDRLTGTDIRAALRHRLAKLNQSSHRSVAVSADLLRYATAVHMVYHMLPSGRSVTYIPDDDEEIPTIPVSDETEPASALTAATDVIVAGPGRASVRAGAAPGLPGGRRHRARPQSAHPGPGTTRGGALMRDPKERLRDILEAIAAIERHLDRGRAAFEQDELLQGWFVRNLQTIGEPAQSEACQSWHS